jgi:hypothetical protein
MSPHLDKPGAGALGMAALGFTIGGAAAALVAAFGRRNGRAPESTPSNAPSSDDSREARALHTSAAMLALSVLADSVIEHYRGSFKNPGMYAPLLASSATLTAGMEGGLARWPRLLARARKIAYATASATGLVGAAFHIHNVFGRPGGFGWLNLFYGAPIGAPAALSVAGLFGLAAEDIGRQASGRETTLLGLPAGRALSALSGAAFAGASAEAWLLHFRGAFQNPFMLLPVTIGPVAAGLMVEAAVRGKGRGFTRHWLLMTGVMGVAGTGFHIYGVSRAMGGWRNWSQNVVDGPPLSAPPSFSAVSLAGLAALSLNERSAHDKQGRPHAVSSL